MNLLDNKTLKRLIVDVSEYFNLRREYIEKDYYITLFLSELVKLVPNLVFKGGTSLSKCHKVINRFSEDVDLTLDHNYWTVGPKKHLKNSIVKVCEKYNFNLINFEDIRSRRDYNLYRIKYPIIFSSTNINDTLLVETTYISKAYPFENCKCSSIIYDYLKEINRSDIIEMYELEPFDIKVQALEKTFVDKVFAICDYKMRNLVERNSRHIYDLNRLLTRVEINEDLKKLFNEVRIERSINPRCYSASKEVNINEILSEIISSDFFKDDFNKLTKNLLYNTIKYEDTIETLKYIINSGLCI